MQQRELKNKEIKQIATRVGIETYHRLRRAAFENNTSMSTIMENAIIEHLDKNERQIDSPKNLDKGRGNNG